MNGLLPMLEVMMGVHASLRRMVSALFGLTALIGANAPAAADPPTDMRDFGLFAPNARRLSHSVAINPLDPKQTAAAIQTDLGCYVIVSRNGGAKWEQPVALPLAPLPAGARCFGPVVVYAPDGKRIHAAFGAVDASGPSFFPDVSFHSSSTDGGRTWSAPAIIPAPVDVIYQGVTPETYDLRLGTPLRAADAQHLYLVGVADIGESIYGLIFTRSADGGDTWSPWIVMAEVSKVYAPFNQGVSVTGGLRGRVSVVWDESVDERLRIRVAHSTDYGATFAPAVTAVTDRDDQSLGGRPDAHFGPHGRLHVVYSNFSNGVASVRYASTTDPLLTTWSRPVTVSDAPPFTFDGDYGNPFQIAPLLAVERCGSSALLHVAWLDRRRGRDKLDMFYSRKLLSAGGRWWAGNIRLSDTYSPEISPTSPRFPSPSTALAAGGGQAIALWSYDYSYYPFSAVVASRVDPGRGALNCAGASGK